MWHFLNFDPVFSTPYLAIVKVDHSEDIVLVDLQWRMGGDFWNIMVV